MLRRTLAGVAILVLGASLIFSGSASAHNIDLEKAWELAREYARDIRSLSGGKYLHYSTNCVRAFPNHNHIVRCVIQYQNAADTEKGVYTCKEKIEIYMPPHNRGEDYSLFGRHTSNNHCGPYYLNARPLG
jgi:hypothetical protein